MVKVKCDNCQKKEIESGSEGVYLGYYQGSDKGKRLHVCCDCYKDKEQEYLQDYAFIYSYDKDHLKRKGTGYVKNDDTNCYAGKKDQNGKILKQRDCPHCQPWKHNDNNKNQKKCANCGAVKNSYFVGEGKIFCSLECIDTYRKKNSPPQKSPIIPPKNNNNGSRDNPPP